MCAPDIPSPPDPQQVAKAQTDSNVTTAISNSVLNNPNVISPWGSVSFAPTGQAKVAEKGGLLSLGGFNPAGGNRHFAPDAAASITPQSATPTAMNTTPLDGYSGYYDYYYHTGAAGGAGAADGTVGANGGKKGAALGNVYTIPQYTETITLSPDQQKLYDQQVKLGQGLNDIAGDEVNRIGGILATPATAQGLPKLVSNVAAPDLFSLTGIKAPDLGAARTAVGNAGRVTQFDPNSVGMAGTTLGDTTFAQQQQAAQDALMSRLNPQLDQDRAALRSQLLNEGLAEGSDAYNTAMQRADQQANDARMQAILNSYQVQQQGFNQALAGGQFANEAIGQNNQALIAANQAANAAQGQSFNQMLQRGQFQQQGTTLNNAALTQHLQNQLGLRQAQNTVAQQAFANGLTNAQLSNSARQQGLAENLTLRDEPINEVAALMRGGQVTAPQAQPYNASPIANTPIGNYIYQSYNDQVAAANAANSGLGALGAGLFGMLGKLGGAGGLFAL